MKPIQRKDRAAFQNGPRMSVASVNDPSKVNGIDDFLFLPSENDNGDDIYNEYGSYNFLNGGESKYTDEQIKIKALNLAINMAKLMSDVTLDSILKIADNVAVYIKK